MFLSGAALAMVHRLGWESAKPRLAQPGSDRYLAGLIPQVEHPLFVGLTKTGVDIDASAGGNPRVHSVLISDAGFSAFADFAGTGGPKGGRRWLGRECRAARTRSSSMPPDRGRVIAMGLAIGPLQQWCQCSSGQSGAADGQCARISFVGGAVAAACRGACSGGTAAPSGYRGGRVAGAERAVVDLNETFADRYPKGRYYLRLLRGLKQAHAALLAPVPNAGLHDFQLRHIVDDFRNSSVRHCWPIRCSISTTAADRTGNEAARTARQLAEQFQLAAEGYDNRIAVLSPVRPDGQLTTVYRPEGGRFVGDVELHFDADRLVFDARQPWAVAGFDETSLGCDPRAAVNQRTRRRQLRRLLPAG